jgi:hypothetical protein
MSTLPVYAALLEANADNTLYKTEKNFLRAMFGL